MKAIIITYHCVVGGQRRKRELGRAVREDLMEDTGLKWTLKEGKDWEKQKSHSSQGDLREGFVSCGGGIKARKLDLTCERGFD